MSDKRNFYDCNFLAEIVRFVNNQDDKSKDKIAEALQVKFQISEEELEKLIRLGLLYEYRGIDEHYNGKDFLRGGDREKILLRIINLKSS